MTLLSLALCFLIGWWIEVFFKKASRPPREPEGGFTIRRRAPPAPVGSWPSFLGRGPFERRDQILLLIGVLVLGIVAGSLAGNAIKDFSEWIRRSYYIVVSWLGDRSLTAAIVSAAIGFWISHYRYPLLERGDQFFSAFVGEGGKSAWALQAAVAVFLVLAILLALRPELLDYVESFKAGEVKFSAVSTSTRQTFKFGLRDLIQDVDLVDWKDFKEKYLDKDQPHEQATVAFDQFPVSLDQRREIRDILIGEYVQPIAFLLPCLDRMGKLTDARTQLLPLAGDSRRWVFSMLQSGTIERDELQNMLVSAIKAASSLYSLLTPAWESVCFLTANDQRLYREFKEEINKAARQVEDAEQDINNPEKQKVMKPRYDADKIAYFHDRIDPSKKEFKDFPLTAVEPYVVAAIASLLNFTSAANGQNEKAEFLSSLKSKFPQPSAENKYLNPGIVNFYYQLTEAKLRSEGWPLDEMIEELHLSYKAIHDLLQKASSSTDPAAQTLTPAVRDAIFDRFRTNLFIVLIRFNEIYIARELAGEHLPVDHRIRWENAKRSLEMARNLVGSRDCGRLLLNQHPILDGSSSPDGIWKMSPITFDLMRTLHSRLARSY